MSFFGHVSKTGFVIDEAIAHVDAVEADAPARRFEKPGQNRNGGRLTRAIRAQRDPQYVPGASVKLTSRMAGMAE